MAVPLDLLLTTSATGVARRMLPDASWSRFGLDLARQPGTVAERVGSLGRELAGHRWNPLRAPTSMNGDRVHRRPDVILLSGDHAQPAQPKPSSREL